MLISLPQRETTRKLHFGGFLTHLVEIEVGGEKIRAIPKDYQLDPIRDFLMHVDFLRVGEGARLTIAVPVHFKNHLDSPGLKRGGVLNVVRHAIDMVVPADAIPEFVEVDLTGLDIGDSVHISAIALPEGAVPTIRRDFTVATIAGAASVLPEVEEGAAADAAVGAEGEAGAEAEAAAGTEGEAAKGKAEATAKAPPAKAEDEGKGGKGKGKG
jgi:large subunit ribosomal protein L25